MLGDLSLLKKVIEYQHLPGSREMRLYILD
jgi:hypothetical protein